MSQMSQSRRHHRIWRVHWASQDYAVTLKLLKRNMFGGLSHMMDAVEEMTNGFFGELGRPSIFEQEPSADSRRVPDRFFSKEDVPTKPSNESAYGEFAGKVADV